jgi:hypothetical protein
LQANQKETLSLFQPPDSEKKALEDTEPAEALTVSVFYDFANKLIGARSETLHSSPSKTKLQKP